MGEPGILVKEGGEPRRDLLASGGGPSRHLLVNGPAGCVVEEEGSEGLGKAGDDGEVERGGVEALDLCSEVFLSGGEAEV